MISTTTTIGGGDFDGRGVAFADFDNDGDLDLVVTADAGQATRLWRNDSATGNHWLGVRLRGTASNTSAIGARVVVRTAAGAMVQEVSGGAGRGSQNSLPLEFGLGAATVVEELIARWPSGTIQTLRNVAADQYLELTEPRAATRRSGGRRAPAGKRSTFNVRTLAPVRGRPETFNVLTFKRSNVTADPAPAPACCR